MPYLTKEEQTLLTLASEPTEYTGLAVSTIGGAASGITSPILTALANSTLDGFKQYITDYIKRKIGITGVFHDRGISDGIRMVEEVLKTDYDKIITFLEIGYAQGAGGIHASIYEALTGAAALLSSYTGLIQRVGIDPYINRWINSEVRPNIPNAELAWFMHNIHVIDDRRYNEFIAQNGWSEEMKAALEFAWIRPINVGYILDLRRRGTIDDDGVRMLLRWNGYNEGFANTILPLYYQVPEPYRLADFAAKGITPDDQLIKYMGWYGIEKSFAVAWKASQQTYPNFSVALELLWRGVIDVDMLKYWMQRNAMHPDGVDRALALAEQIPPSGDLVTMVVREAFEPKYVVEAPTVFAAEMAKKGYTKLWSDRYWTAHFLYMPIEQAYDNLRRGYWNKEQFLELLRIADIHPKWREDIYNVAFNPPSIREMGYGYDVEAYTIEDIVRYRRWGGLSEDDAKKAAQAMVAYRTEAERNQLRRDFVQMYVIGKISEAELRNYLIYVSTRPEVMTFWLEHASLQKQIKESEVSVTEPRTLTRSDIQWLFEHGIRDEKWMRESLSMLGYEESAINAYVDQSKQRMAEKVKPPEPEAPRKLTLANIQRLIQIGLYNREEATAKVIELGYIKADAELIIQIMAATVFPEPEVRELSDAQVTALYDYNLVSESDILAHFVAQGYSDTDARLLTQLAVITKNLPDLKDMYSKGWITQSQLFEGVKALGIPMEAVEPSEYPKLKKLIEVIGLPEEKAKRVMLTIVKAEQPTRLSAEKDLTKAEIIKGAKAGIITNADAVGLLQSLGYDENEAYYLLAINKVIAAGDPEGYWDMRKVTEAYKKARGEKYVDIPEELIVLEREQRKLKDELEKAKAAKADEVALGVLAVQLAAVETRMRTIVAKLGIK